LETLVDLLPADDRDRILIRAEEPGDRAADEPVALVLELPQPVQVHGRVLEAVEPPHRGVQLDRAAVDDVGLRLRLVRDHLHAVELDVVCRLFDVVADVVEHPREPVEILAVERRHERAVEQGDQLVGEPVALVLSLLDPDGEVLAVGELGEQLDEQAAHLDGVRGRLAVELEELRLLRNESKPCHRRADLSCSPRFRRPNPLVSSPKWWWKTPFSRRIAGRSHPTSRTSRNSSARRSSTSTGSPGSTSRARSSSRRMRTAASWRPSRPTSSCRSRTSTSR